MWRMFAPGCLIQVGPGSQSWFLWQKPKETRKLSFGFWRPHVQSAGGGGRTCSLRVAGYPILSVLSQICTHRRRKSRCKQCGGSSVGGPTLAWPCLPRFVLAARAVCVWLDIRSYLCLRRSARTGGSRGDASNAAARRRRRRRPLLLCLPLLPPHQLLQSSHRPMPSWRRPLPSCLPLPSSHQPLPSSCSAGRCRRRAGAGSAQGVQVQGV